MSELICKVTFRIETRDLRVPGVSGVRLISGSAMLDAVGLATLDGGNANTAEASTRPKEEIMSRVVFGGCCSSEPLLIY
jgi:hypothetical protein